MTAPLTPAGCDLRDFPRMMIDIPRLRGSEFDALADDRAWRAGLNLWLSAWHQVPAGSVSSEDAALAKAAGLGRDLRTWRKVKEQALRGWTLCDDGRLYHPVVCEMALEAWIEKLRQAVSSGHGNARRWNTPFDPAPITAEIEAAVERLAALNARSKALVRHVRKTAQQDPAGKPVGTPKGVPIQSLGTGTGTGTVIPKDKSLGVASPVAEQEAVLKDPDAQAWDAAVRVLISQGGMAEPDARRFFGGLIARNKLQARDLLTALASAVLNQTRDPKSYLNRVAQLVAERKQKAAEPTKPKFPGVF